MTYHSQKKQFQLTNKSDNLSRREVLKIGALGLSTVGLGALGMMSTPGAVGFAATGDHEEKASMTTVFTGLIRPTAPRLPAA